MFHIKKKYFVICWHIYVVDTMFPIVCVQIQLYITEQKAGSAGDEGVEAVCPFDSASVALNADELTVCTKPSGQGDHLGRREKENLLVDVFHNAAFTDSSDGPTLCFPKLTAHSKVMETQQVFSSRDYTLIKTQL